MENLRAYMIVNAVKECDVTFVSIPVIWKQIRILPRRSQKMAFSLLLTPVKTLSKAEGILKPRTTSDLMSL